MPLNLEPVIYAVPLFLLCIALEVFINYRERKHLYEAKDSLASIAMGLGSLVIGAGVKFFYLWLFFVIYQFRIFDFGENFVDHAWWTWIVLFFADDLSFYWHHRMSHEVRVLWAAHVNHHSSMNLNFSTALRQSWFELFYKYIFWMWLPLVGFHPLNIMIMMSISLIFQFLQHTELVRKLGPLEWVFNTPSHHRVHHASNIRYLDRNHAGMLIIWDRLFGTFEEEDFKEPPKYGLTVNIHTYNPLQIATHEYQALWKDVKRAPTFKDKLKYIFYPPGWSHDGDNKTANYLRAQIAKQQAAARSGKKKGKVA